MAEAAVCNLPQIEPSDIVFARRKLKPVEIEALALRRGQIVQCSVGDEVETSAANHAVESMFNSSTQFLTSGRLFNLVF
jgi:hypothetical protein